VAGGQTRHRGPLSAAAFYYGLTLFHALDIPIGLVTSHWGGTRIEPWTPPCGFESVPSLKPILDSLAQLKPQAEGAKGLHQQPTVLYNRMIYPFVPYTFRGAIWYQGESNLGDGAAYCDKMHALVNGWKKVFENPDLKFYFVQLAPFTYGGDGKALPLFWEPAEIHRGGKRRGHGRHHGRRQSARHPPQRQRDRRPSARPAGAQPRLRHEDSQSRLAHTEGKQGRERQIRPLVQSRGELVHDGQCAREKLRSRRRGQPVRRSEGRNQRRHSS
jgi:hypothetical protein